MALGKQGVTEMIGRERVGGPKVKLGAKFLGGGFERTLVKINETRVIMSVGKTGIELQCGFELCECVGVVLLLSIGLAKEKMDIGIAGVLFEK
jgi:hypothetical protein